MSITMRPPRNYSFDHPVVPFAIEPTSMPDLGVLSDQQLLALDLQSLSWFKKLKEQDKKKGKLDHADDSHDLSFWT